MNYSVVNYSRQGKLRRLWRLAVATQPPIADYLLKVTRIYQKPTANSEVAQLAVGGVMVMKISKIKFMVY